ncbi:MAG: hypothetical protein IE917_09985 [Betaproteobacteria bacterium]|nr:hypothetical protein [Betaproteobacteria bacterium]
MGVSGCEESKHSHIPVPINGFELETLGAAAYPDAVFGLGYAFSHGFHQVTLGEYQYTQEMRGIIFKQSASEQQKSQYIVQVDQTSSAEWPAVIKRFVSPGKVRIIDRRTQESIASMTIPRDGWPGDQVGKWLASMFHPDATHSKPTYELTSPKAGVELIAPSSELHPNEIKNHLHYLTETCPASIGVAVGRFDHSGAEIRAPNWTMLTPYGFKQAVCIEEGVLVFASFNQEDLEVLWLTYDGEIKGRGFIRNKKLNLHFSHHLTRIVSARFVGKTLQVQQAYFLLPAPFAKPIVAAYEAQFTFTTSELLANNGS